MEQVELLEQVEEVEQVKMGCEEKEKELKKTEWGEFLANNHQIPAENVISSPQTQMEFSAQLILSLFSGLTPVLCDVVNQRLKSRLGKKLSVIWNMQTMQTCQNFYICF